ncbi:MAG: MFS transporter [Burkholderiales bacterium]|nr:MFS transporter [Burkholderiales bacterium]
MDRGRAAGQKDPLPLAVCALGLAQITAWGTAYYCLGVLARPIAADTGWSLSFVYSGFTIALLAMAAVSPWAGRAIDRHGARPVMLAGTVLVAAGLGLLSRVESESGWLAVWAFLGLGMRLTLYDAAFAALVQIVPSRGRLAISILTLFGAFASTVFWVLGHYLNEAGGWRATLAGFAAIHLAVCLPLNWVAFVRRETRDDAAARAGPATPRDAPPLRGARRVVAIALLSLVMSLNAFVFGVTTVQLVPMLEAAGLGAAAAVWVASMKGFAQFGGRLLEIAFGRRLAAMTVARIAIGLLPLAFALLAFSGGSLALVLAFTLLMGAAQGVITIVRGALPLALFGTTGYATVLGVLATPAILANAAAPTLFAWIVERWDWRTGQATLLATSLGSWAAIELMARWYARSRPAPADR